MGNSRLFGGGAAVSDVAGRISAATSFRAIKGLSEALLLHAVFLAAGLAGSVTRPLRELATIHFIQWTVMDSVADGKGGRLGLGGRWLYFESNFDGDGEEYADSFVHAAPLLMELVWSRTKGYPGLVPIDDFMAWTAGHHMPASHFYAAYPDATTSMVGAALRVYDRYQRFLSDVAEADSDRFVAEYERFLTHVQGDL